MSLLGCAHSNKAPSREIESRTTPLSLTIPELGPVQFPDRSPYPNGSRSESAYRDGFSEGWRIIQHAGKGALVYAPSDYSADDVLRDAWHRGVVDGKSSAYEKVTARVPESTLGY